MSAARRVAAAGRCGFTLIELLAVVALVAVLAAVWLSAASTGGRAAALRSAEATLANLLVAARTRAVASGGQTRVLVQCDPQSPHAAERFLRYFVVQAHDGVGWNTIGDAHLPAGSYLVPRQPAGIPELLPAGVEWTRPSDREVLRSTALRGSSEFADAEFEGAINATVAEKWAAIVFSPIGTTRNSGDLVIALGRRTPGATPVKLAAPEAVCGATLSVYGVVALVPDRSGF